MTNSVFICFSVMINLSAGILLLFTYPTQLQIFKFFRKEMHTYRLQSMVVQYSLLYKIYSRLMECINLACLLSWNFFNEPWNPSRYKLFVSTEWLIVNDTYWHLAKERDSWRCSKEWFHKLQYLWIVLFISNKTLFVIFLACFIPIVIFMIFENPFCCLWIISQTNILALRNLLCQGIESNL